MTILKSPIMSYTITADIRDVRSMCTYDENDHSDRADAESHVVEVTKYKDAEGNTCSPMVFKLTSDAHRDSAMLDWILSHKDASEEETLGDFNDLMNQQFNERTEAGGLSGLGAYEA